MGDKDASLPLGWGSNFRLCDLSLQSHRESWLMFVWFLLGCGPYLAPALGSLSLPWTGLTVPSDIVQTRLQTFPGKGQQQPGEEAAG